MTAPIAIDTPDYQRGTVNPQVLLATVPAGTDHVTVSVPPNAETLIVTASNVGTNPTVYAQGTTTLYKFPGKVAIQQPFITSAPTWFFDVSQSVDSNVLVQFSAAPGTTWFVYADSAAHLVVDPSRLVNGYGQAYSIPSIPSPLAGDHPPNELSNAFANLSANGNVLAAPGAGVRYRLFAANMCPSAAGVQAILAINGGNWLLPCYAGGNAQLNLPGQGFPLPVNTALVLTGFAGAGTMLTVVYYTTETF